MIRIVVSIVIVGLALNCSKDVTSVTETDTGTISGWVVNDENEGVMGAEVILRDVQSSRSDTTTTVSSGYFKFSEVDTGTYYIEINDSDTRGALLQTTVDHSKKDHTVDTVTVKELGSIKGNISEAVASDDMYVYIIAIDRKIPVDSLGQFIIDNIPMSEYTIYVVESTGSDPQPIDSVEVSVDKKDTVTVYDIGIGNGLLEIRGSVYE